MFSVRYLRYVSKTYEYLYQVAKYSQLQKTKFSFKLPHAALLHNSFCTVSNNGVASVHEMYNPDIEAIAKGDPELEKKVKLLLLEIEVLQQEGVLVPSPGFMKEEDWKELVKLQSRASRKKYLLFLFKKEKTKENAKLKKEKKRLEYENFKLESEELPEGAISYGFTGSNIFLRFYESTMNSFYNSRLIKAMLFGQKLVVDCGFGEHMTKHESINCAKQLMLLFADNRFNDDPYDLHFCNFKSEGIVQEYFRRQVPTLDDPSFPLNLHEESYLDLFPRDQLVYLTPHCNETIEQYDHDAIYIIGAIVDKSNQEPLSLAKAKKEKLRMAKFPLDKYLQWGSGSGKSLTLNQCIKILLDVKRTGDWKFALQHVPKRKVVDYNTLATDPNLVYNKRLRKFKTIWKPSAGVGKFNYNPQRRTTSLYDADDEEDTRKPRVNVKNVMK